MVDVDTSRQNSIFIEGRAVLQPRVIGVIRLVDEVVVGLCAVAARSLLLACSSSAATSSGDTVLADQAGFESVQPEGCQHQQPRDECDEQPRHELK